MIRYAATPQVSALCVGVPIAPWRVSAGRRRLRCRDHGRGLIRRIARIGVITLMAVAERAHYYQDCGDPDCMMFGCRAYKTGWRDGYDQGYEEGYGAGYGAGYSAGFSAGLASCSCGGGG